MLFPLAVAVLLFIIFLSPTGIAEDRQDITRQCVIRMPGSKVDQKLAFDGLYKTYYSRYDSRKYEISVILPEGLAQGGLYLCFFDEPEKIIVLENGREIYQTEGTSFAHRYIPFNSGGPITIQLWGNKKGFSLSEMYVFEGENPPDWVQRWQPTHEKADLLILVAHPDDEFLWTGGAIPYYALERGKRVVVGYMTCANGLRRSEMLNALWLAGIRNYPVIGRFRDRTVPGLKASRELWGGESKIEGFITRLYRRLKPDVVVTHDLKGEYGHLAHILTAKGAISALDAAADKTRYTDSAGEFGTWAVPKLYIHLYKENPLVMEWDQPISAHGGKTAMQIGIEAFQTYRSQQRNFKLSPDGPYSLKHFGLYRSLVGDDIQKNDFFENIEEAGQ